MPADDEDELETLQRELEAAKIRRAEALHRHGADSSQFIAACDAHDLIEKRIKEIRSR
jgi:hypothetical protein